MQILTEYEDDAGGEREFEEWMHKVHWRTLIKLMEDEMFRAKLKNGKQSP